MNDIRASCWSLTINNPTESDEENIYMARQKTWKVEGQKEVGKNGTPHYQLLLQTPQVRIASIKKAFPRAHIEVCRDKAALKKYVHKEETRVGEMQEASENYPSQQKVWDMFSEHIYRNSLDEKDRSIAIEDYNAESWLAKFDYWVRIAIEEGYVVETIAVNPQTRSCLKNYGYSIYLRSKLRNFGGYVRRQTDRQTDETDEVRQLFENCFADNFSLLNGINHEDADDTQVASLRTINEEKDTEEEGINDTSDCKDDSGKDDF